LKTKFFFLLILIILFSFIPLQITENVEAIGENWLTGYTYRRSHVIVHAANAGMNYQKRIIIKNGTSEGVSTTFETNDTITINNKIRTDFGDVNFTSDDGSTCLKYWIEVLNIGKNATFWVKVSADLSSVDQTIYVYYGKTGQTTGSNIRLTGIWGDDFENNSISDWTAVDDTPATSNTVAHQGTYSCQFYYASSYCSM
jgi:hypothetical protein